MAPLILDVLERSKSKCQDHYSKFETLCGTGMWRWSQGEDKDTGVIISNNKLEIPNGVIATFKQKKIIDMGDIFKTDIHYNRSSETFFFVKLWYT